MTDTERTHILGQVAGINKAVRMINRECPANKGEMDLLRRIFKALTEEGRVLLKEAEAKPPIS